LLEGAPGTGIVPTGVGVNREVMSDMLATLDCPHGRGGEPLGRS